MQEKRITVAHSPDSDDAFMFFGLASGAVDTHGIVVDQVLADIETLNRAAFEGKYEVTHFRTGKGLEPGEYRVAISKLVMQDGSPIPPGTSSAAELDTKNLLPAKFSDPNNTTLKANVASGGKPIDFALTSQ